MSAMSRHQRELIELDLRTPRCICGHPGRELEFRLGGAVRFPCGHNLTEGEFKDAMRKGKERVKAFRGMKP